MVRVGQFFEFVELILSLKKYLGGGLGGPIDKHVGSTLVNFLSL